MKRTTRQGWWSRVRANSPVVFPIPGDDDDNDDSGDDAHGDADGNADENRRGGGRRRRRGGRGRRRRSENGDDGAQASGDQRDDDAWGGDDDDEEGDVNGNVAEPVTDAATTEQSAADETVGDETVADETVADEAAAASGDETAAPSKAPAGAETQATLEFETPATQAPETASDTGLSPSFELIEIPHVRISGKNSADIRMVVDALDLCYTKPHLDTFVIISGDSDFSPLVSKLRENDREVIGVGVRTSTSDLLTHICDEFIFYDDLVLEKERPAKRKRRGGRGKATKTETASAEKSEEAKQEDKAIEWVLEIATALLDARDDGEKVWGSMVKQSLKRRRLGFNEKAFGFANFGALLEEAQTRGALRLTADETSGGYIVEEVLA